jgi:hypothetical protein
MKSRFKPLGLAAAVAAASAGYAGVVNAGDAEPAEGGLGDLAIVPYYTVQGSWGTGIHVINTSPRTQVVKFRFRRAADSLDALDFNIIMSPYDEWTGFMNDTDGTIAVTTQDSTCTAPLFENGRFEMPNIYRSGADEGYVEVIAMGSPFTETMPLAVNAKHAPGGKPKNCQLVEDNFLDAFLGLAAEDPRGIHNNYTSAHLDDVTDADKEFYYCDGYLPGLPSADPDGDGQPDVCITEYGDGGNFMKVSWFIRDADAGIEFGNDATTMKDFAYDPMMTHQEQGVFSGNLRGFDFPDLDGGSPYINQPDVWGVAGAFYDTRGEYNEIRESDGLGVTDVLNDWSNNPDLNVGTDWVITIPGQYLMLDQPLYWQTLGNRGGFDTSQPGGIIGGATDVNGDPIQCNSTYATVSGVAELPQCDFRDIPVTADFTVYDREENRAAPPPGDRDVVISPSLPGLPPTATLLRYEVNVIHWGEEVLPSDYDEVDVSGLLSLLAPANSGWASLAISSKRPIGSNTPDLRVCEWDADYWTFQADLANRVPGAALYDPNAPMTCEPDSADDLPPMTGFVAWERSFPANPDGNYGRAVAHSFENDD